MGIRTIDLAWCAGFLEGEGSFVINKTTIGVTCAQVQREPLERLQKLLGGTIYSRRHKRTDKPNWTPEFFVWCIYGKNAAAIMMTLLAFMSPKRWTQIIKCMDHWKSLTGGYKGALQCKRGHPFEGDNLYIQPSNKGRKCRQCAKLHYQKLRAKRLVAAAAAVTT
jgi:hypothetical protein